MLSDDERQEVRDLIESLRGALDDLVLRGLKTAGPDDLRALDALRGECARIGAGHLAERAGRLLDAVRGGEAAAPGLLLRAQTSLRVFERVLTLEAVADVLDAAAGEAEKIVAAPAPPRPAAGPLTLEEGRGLVPTLEDLARAVEDLVATGLTTASAATRQKLDVSMKEALRLKLGRLGASLRFVNEETGRFLARDAGFSNKRLSFFLNRSWALARGLLRAIRAKDAAAFAKLLLTPATVPVKRLEAVSLGAGKRIVRGTSSCAFEFRLRALSAAGPVADGQRLVWSCLYSYTSTFPAEAFLHLPQPQRFLPRIFSEPRRIVIEKAAVALDDTGGGRLLLGPDSTVAAADGDVPWERFLDFDPAATAARLRAHVPGPLDLEVEPQEEVALRDWTVGAPAPRPGRPDQLLYPVLAGELEFDAVAPAGEDGKELREALDGFRAAKASPPPLFGLVHFELCRPVLQPLAVIEEGGPRHLMLSGEREFDPKTIADLTRAIMNKR